MGTEKERLAPIIIPTLNRYEHFKNCVESLKKDKLASQTELIIGLDYPPSEKYVNGYNSIKDYIPTICGFKEVIVLESKTNLGPIENVNRLKEYVKNKNYDSYIFTEDDNVFSSCFLQFINDALNKYRFDRNILSISGYSHKECYSFPSRFYFTYDSCAWGLGCWINKENALDNIFDNNEYFEQKIRNYKSLFYILKNYPSLLLMLLYVMNIPRCDVKRTVYNIFEKTYQFRPVISLVRNCGQDGSGLHSGINKTLQEQDIYENDELFLDDNVLAADSAENMRFYKNKSMWKNPFKRILYYPYALIKCIQYFLVQKHEK